MSSSSRAHADAIAAIVASADTETPDFEVVEDHPDEIITIGSTDYLAVAQIVLAYCLYVVVTPRERSAGREYSEIFFVQYVYDDEGDTVCVHVTDDDTVHQLRERAEEIFTYLELSASAN